MLALGRCSGGDALQFSAASEDGPGPRPYNIAVVGAAGRRDLNNGRRRPSLASRRLACDHGERD